MKVAIVGPTHPYKGGIAKHTTELGQQLVQAGHDVTVVSWRHQYPFFYPGQQFVPENEPEVEPLPNTLRVLSWRAPLGWWRWGRKLRQFDQVIFVWWVPTIQGPVYTAMLRALGRAVPTTLLCHNVLPHEPRRGDRQLARQVLARVTQIVVHNTAQATIAQGLGATDIKVADLPPVLPPRKQTKPQNRPLKKHLLFFGIVRPYKGLDILLKALAEVPEVSLTVAGEIWGENEYLELVQQLGIADRVTFQDNYVPDEAIEALFHTADALVLPYRGGTATFNAIYAHYYHLPVLATTAASLADQVRDGVDGLLCEPENVSALADIIRKFYEPGVAKKLQQGIPEISAEKSWHRYVAAFGLK